MQKLNNNEPRPIFTCSFFLNKRVFTRMEVHWEIILHTSNTESSIYNGSPARGLLCFSSFLDLTGIDAPN